MRRSVTALWPCAGPPAFQTTWRLEWQNCKPAPRTQEYHMLASNRRVGFFSTLSVLARAAHHTEHPARIEKDDGHEETGHQ